MLTPEGTESQEADRARDSSHPGFLADDRGLVQ